MKKSCCIILALLISLSIFAGCAKTEDTVLENEDDEAISGNSEEINQEYNYSDVFDESGFFEGVTATDYITLPEYKSITISDDILTASEEEIQEQVDYILENYYTYEQITDRAVQDGDTLNIDYVGSVDGVEFEGGSTNGAGTEVTIGVTNYIDDFLEQLIGHMPGETFDIEVTFPDPYQNNAELAGKDAIFNVTINYILGEANEPELTDEIAADYNFDSAELLLEDIEREVVNNKLYNFVMQLLSEAEASDIPDKVLNFVKEVEMEYYEVYADAYGMDIDSFIQEVFGYGSKEEYLEAQADNYELQAKLMLAIQAIAEIEGLEVSQEEMEASEYANYIEAYGQGFVKRLILQNSVVPNFILENAA